MQKGVLWWAANHREHHKYSDQEEDVHSPVQRGFWWSHVGWILAPDYDATEFERIPDLAKYPELRWLNDHYLRAAGRARRAALSGRRRDLAGVGLLRQHDAALARDVHDQLARARVRQPPLRDHRRQPQQRLAGAAHPGRGLAQQPPPLHELGPPGLLLVGDRRQLLRAGGAVVVRAGVGSAPAAAAGCSHRRRRLREPRSSSAPPDGKENVVRCPFFVVRSSKPSGNGKRTTNNGQRSTTTSRRPTTPTKRRARTSPSRRACSAARVPSSPPAAP